MNLILASDFPSTPCRAVAERIRAAATEPRIAWIPPHTDADRTYFGQAREKFGELGFPQLEYLDIDEELDQVQVAYLHEFDVIYLAGGDPVRFRYNALRAGLSGRLRQCASRGRCIVGASGGALLLTPNVSLGRLHADSLDDVLATRGRFDALGAVSYEVLPHANRWDAEFLDKVRQYSGRAATTVVAIADGGALFPADAERFDAVGTVTTYRHGEII